MNHEQAASTGQIDFRRLVNRWRRLGEHYSKELLQQPTSNDPAAPFSVSQRGGTVNTFLGKCPKSPSTFGEHRNLARQMLTQGSFRDFAEVSTANWAVF